MRIIVRFLLPQVFTLGICGRLYAQLPFYTDDAAVTERGKWHFEFFNEYDALQLQYPNLGKILRISSSTMACHTTLKRKERNVLFGGLDRNALGLSLIILRVSQDVQWSQCAGRSI
jgi:hypothetical protein